MDATQPTPNFPVKGRKRILAGNAFLLALLFGLVSFNKSVLRPAFHGRPFLDTLTGCFPNFLAALLISLAFVNAIVNRNPRHGRLLAYLGSTIVFVILTIEELKPMWGASTYYDLYDIVASAVGSLLAIGIFEWISRRQKIVTDSN
ncbi:hypothetical protein [Prolixibacter denitrificans]|uniref:VanZ like protein n=1 Tax=Prolixibacter denitrificans TaxID=1541063 RepID=A0A2P8C6D9_9BACT|nr:hypothetical protein [Prolixibacter denitrificans]PSK80521.1 hypothetical protein CLV93_11551 [Prolixibacter denitrificans]GET22704.1 hypothetical protein JCM18694_29500 [Prolixibacter denitrificans]